LAAKRATATIPIITVGVGDIVETGLVASSARPGGNITGINDPAATLSAKRLEILKEMVPSVKRVAVLWNADDNAMTLRYQQIERAAQVLHVSVEPLGVREPDDFAAALGAMNRARPDALMMVADALTNLNRQQVFEYAAKNGIPAMYERSDAVAQGGLMSYGADAGENFKLTAEYVAKVLKGAKPADLPVQQPNRYYLVVNLKAAKALGLTIPQSLLLRADEVIR
jgi:putative ABC transport system substrate-binding protein